MPTTHQQHPNTVESWLVSHPITAGDSAKMAAMRTIVESNKGRLQGTAARVPFNGIMERVAPPEGVSYEADHVGAFLESGAAPRMHDQERSSCTFTVDGSTGAPHTFHRPESLTCCRGMSLRVRLREE